jgi:hypothetical protein
MIIEYIENLRRQPLEVRRTAARFWTGVIVAIIVALYLVYLLVDVTVLTDTPRTNIQAPYEK